MAIKNIVQYRRYGVLSEDKKTAYIASILRFQDNDSVDVIVAPLEINGEIRNVPKSWIVGPATAKKYLTQV